MRFGLVGKICSGKDVVAGFFREKGYKIIRYSELLEEILYVLGLESSRENMQVLANSLRGGFGGDVLSKALIYKNYGVKDLIVNGIRSRGEFDYLKKNGFKIIGIKCSAENRFKRVNERKRFGKKITLEEFKKIEDNDAERFIDELVSISDVKIDNDSSLKNLKKQFDELFNQV